MPKRDLLSLFILNYNIEIVQNFFHIYQISSPHISIYMKPKILSNVAFFKNFLFFQTFLKFAGTGSHPELPFTPKSVAFSRILQKYRGDFWSPL